MLVDFGGRETNNTRLLPGQVLELDDTLALRLIGEGKAAPETLAVEDGRERSGLLSSPAPARPSTEGEGVNNGIPKKRARNNRNHRQ